MPPCVTIDVKVLRIEGIPGAAALEAAAAAVKAGGTLIFPTDTVYGIGCAPDNAVAIEAIFAAKRRPADKPLAIHVGAPADAREFAAFLTRGALAIMDRLWPGPISIIVARNPLRGATAARGGTTIALRCPNDAACSAILRATGPVAATSANVSGAPAYAGENDDLSALPNADVAIIAGPTKQRRESTVLDCTTDVVRIARIGALSPGIVAKALAGIAQLEPSRQ